MELSNKKKSYTNLPVSPIKSSESKEKTVPVTEFHKDTIIISYKYFKCSSSKGKKFNNCFKDINDYATWITFFIKRVSEFSTMRIEEISSAGSSTRFHLVKHRHLKKLKDVLSGIGVNVGSIFSQEEGCNYYELSFGTSNGRVFGYLIGNIYYILLLDPNHLIYENVSKGAKQDLLYKNYDPWKSLNINVNDLRR